MRTAVVAALALLPLALPPAGAAHPVADGGGVVLSDSVLCAHAPAPAALHLTLATPGAGRWTIEIEGHSLIGCPVTDVAHCGGSGSLEEGIEVTLCAPLDGTGFLGPFEEVLAFCAEPCPDVLAGPVFFAFPLGDYFGGVTLAAPSVPG